MNIKLAALTAIATLGVAAHAQTFNWTLTTTGTQRPGDGSGSLTITSGVITSMSGTVGGPAGIVTLIPVLGWSFNDNVYPSPDGVAFSVAGFGNVIIYDLEPGIEWASSSSSGAASFVLTAVPEPSTWATGAVFGMSALATVMARRRWSAAKG